MSMRKLLSLVACLWVANVPTVYADDQSSDGPMLTIRGDKSGDSVVFDLQRLQSMAQTQFETTTIWTTGVHKFTGVPLAALLETAGFDQGIARARAANDYAIEIPISTVTPSAPIVAWKMDGKLIPRRAKGPYWIVFPYDSDIKYQTETIYSQSIWQLQSIDVIEP